VNSTASLDLERDPDSDQVERGLDNNGLVGAHSGSDSDGSQTNNTEGDQHGPGGSKATEKQSLRRPTKRARTDKDGERNVHGWCFPQVHCF
jgi:hypothetical protein